MRACVRPNLVVVALRRAAVDLVILHQPLSEGDAPQQVLYEALDPHFAAGLLSRRRFQKLLDGYHLPGKKTNNQKINKITSEDGTLMKVLLRNHKQGFCFKENQ